MKQITAKYIRDIEKMSDEEIHKALNEETELTPVAHVNWKEYPYCPEVGFHLAYSDNVMAVMFKVKENHLRGAAMEINGPVWEDSCVEVFIADPFSKEYFNFETNCIGTQLASKRRSRTEADHFDAEAMSKIRCFASLPHEPIDSVAPDQSWWLVELIPFAAIGLDKAPESLRGNFYKCGDKCKDMHFLSWTEIGLPAPNFHCPEFFGEILFK